MNLDERTLAGLRAFHARTGHIFPGHKHRYRGATLRLNIMGLLWRIEHDRGVAPAVVRELKRLGCPLTQAAYSLERRMHELCACIRAHGVDGVPVGSDLRLFMRSLRTPRGEPAPNVTASMRARLEALPGWNWACAPKARRKRAAAEPQHKEPSARPKPLRRRNA